MALVAAVGVGCAGGNFSNPTLSITQAQMRQDAATLDLEVRNPSSVDLELRSIDYSLEYGILPVASGRWSASMSVPSGQQVDFRLPVRFDAPPVEPGREITLSGVMQFDDLSNSGEMRLESTSFSATAPVNR